jgi:hypothetical protein
MSELSVQIRLNLAEGDKAFLWQQDGLLSKDKLATMVQSANGNADGSLYDFWMHFVEDAVNLPSCFDQSWI